MAAVGDLIRDLFADLQFLQVLFLYGDLCHALFVRFCRKFFAVEDEGDLGSLFGLFPVDLQRGAEDELFRSSGLFSASGKPFRSSAV